MKAVLTQLVLIKPEKIFQLLELLIKKVSILSVSPCQKKFQLSKTKAPLRGALYYLPRTEAQQDVLDYIAMFYNSQRLHSYLDYTSPNDYESAMAEMKKAA
jgi:transposase InsO family protein